MSSRSTAAQSQRAARPRISETLPRLRESRSVGLRSTNKSYATSIRPAAWTSRADALRASDSVQACQRLLWRLLIPPTRPDAVLLSGLTDGFVCRSPGNGWTNAITCSLSLFDVNSSRALSHPSLPGAVCVIVLASNGLFRAVAGAHIVLAASRSEVVALAQVIKPFDLHTPGGSALPVFAIDHLEVRFGCNLVLAHCTLTISRGVTCIMGQSGTGKSTLLKAMIGLVPVERGHVRFRGHDITALDTQQLELGRRDIAFVFQSGALFSSPNVFDNCALTLRERNRLSEGETRTRVMDALERFGLTNAALRMPAELSGGMIKRAGIARALALRPHVLLLDEPTTVPIRSRPPQSCTISKRLPASRRSPR